MLVGCKRGDDVVPISGSPAGPHRHRPGGPAGPVEPVPAAEGPPRSGVPASQGRSVLRLQPAGDVPAQACDLQALERLPARDITTALPPALGLAGEHRWTGVPLRHLVEQLGGGERSRIVLTALNDYAVEIPWSDLLRYNPCWPTGATASEWAFATRGR